MDSIIQVDLENKNRSFVSLLSTRAHTPPLPSSKCSLHFRVYSFSQCIPCSLSILFKIRPFFSYISCVGKKKKKGILCSFFFNRYSASACHPIRTVPNFDEVNHRLILHQNFVFFTEFTLVFSERIIHSVFKIEGYRQRRI